MLLSYISLILTTCAIGFASAAATPHGLARWSSRHNGLQPIQKRASGQFTYYAVGMGACGKPNIDSDFVVALNTPSWAGGSHCFEMITITVNSITTQAQVVDRCESCGPEDLDFSSGLFHFFGGTDAQGVMSGTWSFGSSPVPTTTSTTPPAPSATSTSTPPSSTNTQPPSTTSEPLTTTSPSPSPSSTASDTAAAPIPTGVLAQSLFILGGLGELVLAGGSVRQ